MMTDDGEVGDGDDDDGTSGCTRRDGLVGVGFMYSTDDDDDGFAGATAGVYVGMLRLSNRLG